MNHAFEQLPKESAKAFAAFSLYLNLGAERSLAAVAQKLSKSEQLLKRWSAKFDWPARVAAHAAHLAVVERGAIEATARGKAAEWEKRETQLRETEWSMHEAAIAAAKRGLAAYMDKDKVYANLADIAIPGLRSGADEDKAKKVVGTVMAKLFRDRDTVEVDGYVVTREEKYVSRDNSSDGGSFKSKTYTVTKP